MSWEELSALSTFGTLIIIAASVIAAVVQLRHMRSANTITGFLGLMDRWASPEARAIQNYVFGPELDRKLADAAYRRAEDAVMESGGPTAIRAWERLKPVVALIRHRRGASVYDNFEYLASRAIIWEAKHPDGVYPNRTPHLPTPDPNLDGLDGRNAGSPPPSSAR